MVLKIDGSHRAVSQQIDNGNCMHATTCHEALTIQDFCLLWNLLKYVVGNCWNSNFSETDKQMKNTSHLQDFVLPTGIFFQIPLNTYKASWSTFASHFKSKWLRCINGIRKWQSAELQESFSCFKSAAWKWQLSQKSLVRSLKKSYVTFCYVIWRHCLHCNVIFACLSPITAWVTEAVTLSTGSWHHLERRCKSFGW